MFQIIAYIIFQLAGGPGLGGEGGGVRRVGDCGGETVPTLLDAESSERSMSLCPLGRSLYRSGEAIEGNIAVSQMLLT